MLAAISFKPRQRLQQHGRYCRRPLSPLLLVRGRNEFCWHFYIVSVALMLHVNETRCEKLRVKYSDVTSKDLRDNSLVFSNAVYLVCNFSFEYVGCSL